MMTRRSFLKNSALTLATSCAPGVSWGLHRLQARDPHFFLALTYFGGWDHSYLFDARPLDMTRKGKIQNYSEKEPFVWAQGDSEIWLANPLTAPLQTQASEIAIVKGVMMATTFDGHGQNENYIFTGNPFGGDSFVPVLNNKGKTAALQIPMDGVLSGGTTTTLTNGERMVELSPYDLKSMVDELRGSPVSPSTAEYQFLMSRYQDLASTGSGFSEGSRKLLLAAEKAVELSQRLVKMDTGFSEIQNETKAFVAMLSQVFAHRVSFSAQLNRYSSFDTHSASGARSQPETFTSTVQEIKTLLDLFKGTPFDEQRSLLDVTTIMITSEFSRTMRIQGFPIDETGTNHNTFNNTVLFAGKGIRGGQVIGGTDFQSAAEQLSAAHLQIDPTQEKIFGKPFDFTLQKATNEKPTEFKPENYLNFKNVVNTLFSLFEVPAEYWWSLDRQNPPAPVLSRLLK